MLGKKGNWYDMPVAFVVILVLLVFCIGLGIAYKNISAGLKQTPSSVIGQPNSQLYNDSVGVFENNANKFPSFFDFILAGTFMFIWLASLLASWLLGNDTIFIIAFVLIAIVMLVCSFLLGGVVEEIAESGLSTWLVDFPMMWHLLRNSTIYAILYILTVGVALFLKPQQQGGPQ